MKGATVQAFVERILSRVSIHAPNEGSDYPPAPPSPLQKVSIHAPNEGSDVIIPFRDGAIHTVSIHAPNEGSDLTPLMLNLQERFNPRSQ